MTESVMLALIRMSSKKGGSGAIIARTMPRTAIGTANSRQLGLKRGDAGAPVAAVFAATLGGGLAGTRTRGVIYFSPDASACRCKPTLRRRRGKDGGESPGPPPRICTAPAPAA